MPESQPEYIKIHVFVAFRMSHSKTKNRKQVQEGENWTTHFKPVGSHSLLMWFPLNLESAWSII